MIEGLPDRTHVTFGKDELAKIRTKALRRGVWFRALTKAERAQMELTMRIVKRIRSLLLTRVLASVMEKLLEAMESRVGRMTREVGQDLARKLSRIAQNWGNISAKQWETDRNFMRYLTITHMNMSATIKA